MISLVIVDKMKLEWILIAKGIGTFLVVAGHFWPVDSPSYWTEVRRIIYTFHRPLFFFLSGWLYLRWVGKSGHWEAKIGYDKGGWERCTATGRWWQG